MIAITSTGRQVRSHTPAGAQRAIDRDLVRSLAHFARQPELIEWRLRELEAERDIARTLAAAATVCTLTGLVAGTLARRRWLVTAGALAGFWLRHAIRTGLDPLPLLRRWGLRSEEEIIQEHLALRLLRHGLDRFASLRDADPQIQAEAIAAVLLDTVDNEQ